MAHDDTSLVYELGGEGDMEERVGHTFDGRDGGERVAEIIRNVDAFELLIVPLNETGGYRLLDREESEHYLKTWEEMAYAELACRIYRATQRSKRAHDTFKACPERAMIFALVGI